MIKLVCFDIDNTLLMHGQTSVDSRVFDTINKLNAKGILVAVTTGRPFCDVAKLFSPVIDKIIAVCYDGAIAIQNGNVISDYSISRETAYSFMDTYSGRSNLIRAAYGVGGLYVPKNCGNIKEIQNKLTKSGTMSGYVSEAEDIYKIPDAFCKIALYSEDSSYDYSSVIEDWKNYLSLNYCKNGWCEFISRKAGKASSVNIICERFGICLSEVAAFGDGLNDIELLKSVGMGCAMSGSSQDVIAASDFVTDDPIKTVENVVLG